MTKYFCIIVATLLSACTTLPPALNPALEYERDLSFTVSIWQSNKWSESKSHKGYAIIPKADKYRIELFAEGQAHMMTLSSCHREIKTPNPEKQGGWFQAKRYVFEFAADDLIEVGKPCPLSLGIFDKEKGRHGWATIIVDHEDAKLKAETRCNGAKKDNLTTSYCQTRAGLLQVITFDRPVAVGFYSGCELKNPTDQKTFIYKMPKGQCVFHFFDALDERIEHAHYTFGYEASVIRGVD